MTRTIEKAPSRLPRGMTVQDLCRVELVSRITSDVASPVETYRVTNADGSVCDVVVKEGLFHKTAFCVQHKKHDDCEGTARIHCSIDFASEVTR